MSSNKKGGGKKKIKEREREKEDIGSVDIPQHH